MENYSRMVTATAFTPDGKVLATVGLNGEVILWDLATRQGRAALKESGGWALFSPDCTTVASRGSKEGECWLLDLATGRVRTTLRAPGDRVMPLAFAPDGRTLATAVDETGVITLWELSSARERALLTGPPGRVYAAAFAPDGKTLASCAADGSVILWDLTTGKERARLKGQDPSWAGRLAFAPDGKLLASAVGLVRLWDVATGQEVAKLGKPANRLETVAFSPDGKTLASGGPRAAIFLWDVAGAVPKKRTVLRGETQVSAGRVAALAFSPDGTLLASGSGDWLLGYHERGQKFPAGDEPAQLQGAVRLWDVATGQDVTHLPHGTDK